MSVKDMFEAEQGLARAKMLEAETRHRELSAKAKADAAEQALRARVQEGQMVSAMRTNGLQAVSVLSRLLVVARKLMGAVMGVVDSAACEHCGRGGDPELYEKFVKTGVSSPLGLIERIVRLGNSVNGQAQTSMELERLHLGEPSKIIGLQDAGLGPVSLEDAKAKLESAVRAIEGAERRRGMVPPAVPPKALVH